MSRVFAFDEARFGLKVGLRRRWCPFGTRPPWLYEERYEWLWLYAAVDPLSGESVVLFLPHTDGRCLELFLSKLRERFPEGRLGVVLDNSGSHTSTQVQWPQDMTPIRLPPYSPELNPVERWFEELRKSLGNAIFETKQKLEEALTKALEPFWHHPDDLRQLTGYPWWRVAVHLGEDI
jgi:transposase